MATTVPSGQARVKYKLHLHVILTHFPISLFLVSAGFMILHLFMNDQGFEKSSYITLASGAVMMIPTTVTGWFTWKNKYKKAWVKTFIYKSRTAYFMTFLSSILVVLRTFIFLPEGEHLAWHYFFGFGVLLLLVGAILEGYYGERLNHR